MQLMKLWTSDSVFDSIEVVDGLVMVHFLGLSDYMYSLGVGTHSFLYSVLL